MAAPATAAGGSLFDFMNKQIPSSTPNITQQQQTQQEQPKPEQPAFHWGPSGMTQITSQNPPAAQPDRSTTFTPIQPMIETQGSGNDLFSMLNSNISQTTQNTPVPGASTSAFGFMQNQSLSMS